MGRETRCCANSARGRDQINVDIMINFRDGSMPKPSPKLIKNRGLPIDLCDCTDRYRQLETLHLRYAQWDLRTVDLVDPRTGASLCPLFPLDKTRNADGIRRGIESVMDVASLITPTKTGIPPLLKSLIEEYAATGQPPAYLPESQHEPSNPNSNPKDKNP